MGCFGADQPAAPNYGAVTAQTLLAQTMLAPQQYESEAKYQPLYADLAVRNLKSMMPGISEELQRANTAQRTADIGDVTALGSSARAAMLGANPDNAQLLAKLNAQANQGLDAGSGLTLDEQRAMQQQSRAAFAARGMGGGNASIGDELLRQFNLGQTLLRQRQAFAQSVMGNNQSVVGDPWQAILGRPSQGLNYAQAGMQGAGPSLFNPQAGLGLASGVYGVQNEWAAADQGTMGKVGQVSGLIGNVMGGVASGIAMCWVAREVYGEENPKWLMFQAWLLGEGPGWLRGAYRKYGERFAGWMRRHPWSKPMVRWCMDWVIDKGKD